MVGHETVGDHETSVLFTILAQKPAVRVPYRIYLCGVPHVVSRGEVRQELPIVFAEPSTSNRRIAAEVSGEIRKVG